MFTVLPAQPGRVGCLHQVDARFLAGDLVQVRVTRKGFLPEYVPLPIAEWRQWPPPEGITQEAVEANPHWAFYLALQQERCLGQLIAAPGAYGLCTLLDLRVDAAARRQGIATELLRACEDWARTKQLKGILAEASDQNPVACQFLESFGFVLGGVDKLRHHMDPAQANRPAALRESVLLFYYFFA